MLLLASLALSTPLAAAPTSSDPALLKALPPDTLGYIALWEAGKMRQAWAESTWSQFLDDPRMSDLVRYVNQAMKEAAELEQDDAWPVDPQKLCGELEGSVVAFIRPVGVDSFSGGVLVEPAKSAPSIQSLIDLAVHEFDDEHESSELVEIGGATLRIWADRDETGEYEAEGDMVCLLEAPGLVGIVGGDDPGSALATATAIAQRYTGSPETPGLDGSPVLKAARAETGAQGNLEAFIDLGRMIEYFMAEEVDDEEELAIATKIGVPDIAWGYSTFGLGQGEAVDGAIAFKVTPPGGVLGKLQSLFGPAPTSVLKRMPKDVSSVGAMSFDVAGLYDMIFETLGEIDPDVLAMAKGGVQMASGMLGLDIEEELIRQFTGDFGVFSVTLTDREMEFARKGKYGERDEAMAIASGAGLTTEATGVWIGLEDGADLAFTIEDMLSAFGDELSFETSQVHGRAMYHANAESIDFYWAFLDDGLIYCQGFERPVVAMLEVAATKGGETAWDNTRLRSHLESQGGASFAHAVDLASMIRSALYAAQSMGDMVELLDEGDDAAEFFDGMPWPDPSVADIFKGVLRSGLTASNGLYRVSYSIR